MPPDRPNVVLVFVDDMGYGDLGCFGSPYIETPHIDRMATEGAKFTSFYVGAPVCTPSRAALMTGSYAARVGLQEGVLFPGDETGLNPSETTMADLLGEAGYATTCIGKWHLGDREPFLPTNHGFDSFFGVPYSNDMGAGSSSGEYRELPLMRDTETVEAPVDQTTLTRRYTEEAVAFIEENAAADRPFFCYLPHTMPHVPLHTSEPFSDVSKRGDYGDVVSEIDWSVGQILETLDRLGIDGETLVVFTSDNGPWLEKGIDGGSSGPLSKGKMTVWEGGPRVPMVARWPDTIPEGTVCSELVTAMDLFPTVGNLTGVSPEDDHTRDGEDALDLFVDPEAAQSPHDYYVYHTAGGELNAVRDADGWKLHLDSGELYDLHTDVEEKHDIATENQAAVERLRTAADSIAADIEANSRPVGRIE
jgi:arylsulfatase A-like enzyme